MFSPKSISASPPYCRYLGFGGLSVRLSMNGLPTKEKFNIQVLEQLLRQVTDINDINKNPNQHFFTQYTVHDSLSYASIDST